MSTNINSFFIIQLFVFMYREKIINQKYNYAYASGKESEKAKKQPQQTKPAEEEEKERTVDGLLMHYTRKQSPHPCFQHDKGPEMVRRTARHDEPRRRSKSQSHPQRNMSNM